MFGLRWTARPSSIFTFSSSSFSSRPRRHISNQEVNLERIFPGPTLHNFRNRYYLPYRSTANDLYSTQPRQAAPTDKTIMKCAAHFLTAPTADTPGTCLVLIFDNKRYLFGNVAEGTQRASVQRRMGLVKVENIFLTGTVGWGTSGGLLGMMLTVADSLAASRDMMKQSVVESRKKKGLEPEADADLEKRWFNVHGGKNLTHMVAAARRFVFRRGLPLQTHEYKAKTDAPKKDWEPTWQDENIKVWAMVLEPETQQAVRTNTRKRSHDEFVDAENIIEGKSETAEEQEDRYDQMRSSVVSAMFDSPWKLDMLVKTQLSQVPSEIGSIFHRNDKGVMEAYTGPVRYEDPGFVDKEVFIRTPWPASQIENLPPTTPSNTSLCYIIKNHPQRGKFDIKAALALKVPRGPDFAKLTKGQSVLSTDGATITPDMVLGKGKDGSGFAVIDLPSTEYVGPLISRPEWQAQEIMKEFQGIVWILGDGVVEDPRLQEFMKQRSSLQHIVSSKDCCPNKLALESAATAAIRLHLVDPERFPIPKYSNNVPSLTKVPDFTPAAAGLVLQLEPKRALLTEATIPLLDTQSVVKDFPEEILELAKAAQKEVSSEGYLAQLKKSQRDLLQQDAEVISLGTGSSLPSKHRNVSATLVRVPGLGSYLMDCGENTIGQLRRVFGDELPEVLRDLKLIWISHLHADHHLGTVNVIKAWAQATGEIESTRSNELIVASDADMLKWLREYSEVEDYGFDRVHEIRVGERQGHPNLYMFDREEQAAYGLSSLRVCNVSHCMGALAAVFNFVGGFKLAYSGDCRPSPYFAKMAKDATLLIHEATFDDELQGDALAKRHSTTSEALDIGRRMKARRILLTHFSQRYQKTPSMDSGAGGEGQVAIVAFDYMRVKLGDFTKVETFRPALNALYDIGGEGKDEDTDDEVTPAKAVG